MLYKIIQILVFQGIFILLYDFWLQMESFYTLNRIYLLFTSLVSVVLPFVSFQELGLFSLENTIGSISGTQFIQRVHYLEEVVLHSTSFWYFDTLLIVFYFIGISLALAVFLRKAYKLFLLIRNNKKLIKPAYTLVILEDESKVFSFLKFIFIGEKEARTVSDFLLLHEQVHIQQKHSWDLLWFEVLKILLWFNPLVYLYQKRIIALHEYIADAECIKTTPNEQYYNRLLNAIFQVEDIAFVNQFYIQSLLKKRIIMMTKNKSNSRNKLKYLLLIPILALLVFSCTETKNDKDDASQVYDKNERIPYSQIDVPPLYPGCDSEEDIAAQKQCFSTKIQKFVVQNFNIDLAQNLGLQPGKKRIFVLFIIDENGHITGVKARAPHKDLEKEAIRVIQLLPTMIPGKENGHSVKVSYSLPITIIVEE